MAFFSVLVPPTYKTPDRLDKYICDHTPNMNRSKLKSGLVTILVNGKPQKISYKVRPSDRIDVQWEENVPDNIEVVKVSDIPALCRSLFTS